MKRQATEFKVGDVAQEWFGQMGRVSQVTKSEGIERIVMTVAGGDIFSGKARMFDFKFRPQAKTGAQ